MPAPGRHVAGGGINIDDGCWGGHLIEHCDVFETGDHGSFNSWGRDRYWGLQNAATELLPELVNLDAVKPTVLLHNRWRCDHGCGCGAGRITKAHGDVVAH